MAGDAVIIAGDAVADAPEGDISRAAGNSEYKQRKYGKS